MKNPYRKTSVNSRPMAKLSAALLCFVMVSSALADSDAKPEKKKSNPPPPPQIAPPNASVLGKSLTEWLGIYWRWQIAGQDIAQSRVGRVQLLPIPNGDVIGGEFSPGNPALLRGTLEMTLPVGTVVVLPAFAWISERYEGYPGVLDDAPFADDMLLASVHPDLTIDGYPVLSDANKADYFVSALFDPFVEYAAASDYGSVGAVSYQSSGFVAMPLTPGVHTIHLYEPYIIAAGVYPGLPGGLGVIYDNTWILKVKGKAKSKDTH